MTRQAAAYREGRVLLAGDAAHVHAPDGGQGLNTGVQDAVNLGWKLAQVVNRTSPESLLDTYHAERHPVGARVLRNTMALVALRRPDERTKALRDTIAELVAMDEPRRRMAAMMSGLDIHYDLGEGHPLLGRRMPDLDLVTPGGTVRVFTLLHDAQAGPSEPRQALGFRHLAMGRASVGDRRRIWRRLGASGPGPRSSPRRCSDQTRWIRRLGRGRHRHRIARRADYVVRITMTSPSSSDRRGAS